MSEEIMQWKFDITIIAKGDEAKKNRVRDNIKTQLENAKTSGDIISALMNITPSLLPESYEV